MKHLLINILPFFFFLFKNFFLHFRVRELLINVCVSRPVYLNTTASSSIHFLIPLCFRTLLIAMLSQFFPSYSL
jgi:hypothetical protein